MTIEKLHKQFELSLPLEGFEEDQAERLEDGSYRLEDIDLLWEGFFICARINGLLIEG